MPKKGFTVITVSDDLKALLQAEASKQGLSVPALIEQLLKSDKIFKSLESLKYKNPIIIDCPKHGPVKESFCLKKCDTFHLCNKYADIQQQVKSLKLNELRNKEVG